MVCDRCITAVEELFEELGYDVRAVELGKVDVAETPGEEQLETIATQLREKGFELIQEKKDKLVEEIKAKLIAYLQILEKEDDPPKLSEYLSESMHRNYSYLSNRFSSETDLTIERYLIQLKIERVKELVSYQELTLSEIAWKLNYSSVQYLSKQFKNVTGETVSEFRTHLDRSGRQSLDAVRS